ncbi:MAG: hypothetical protein KC550_00290 [Nanoarchaeota archaeon]|nr:hypothetical protein [Nanoarchaeota archaeon]
MNYKAYNLVFGIMTLVLFLIIKQPMLIIISILLILTYFQDFFHKINEKISVPVLIKTIFLTIIIGIVTELLAIWNNRGKTIEHIIETNQLFSPDPILNMIIAMKYYIPLAIIWFFLLKKYKYKTKDLFIIMGITGILFEGAMRVFFTFNPLLWLYAFLVHGSYFTIVYLILKKEISVINNKKEI